MDTNSVESALDPQGSEATYRALRDSILQIYQFGTKIAKEANQENELQVSWELGDTSLMNWISDTHCYLSSKGGKLQFLARPSKLEIISFKLKEGDKLLICNDSLRQKLSDNEIDEILQESHGSENSCQNLLKIANVNNGITDNTLNIVVMEVINNQKFTIPPPLADIGKVSTESSKLNPLRFIIPILLLIIGGGVYWLWKNNSLNFNNILGWNKSAITLEDTLKFIPKDSLSLAEANDIITKEFEGEKETVIPTIQKDDFSKTPTQEFKTNHNSPNSKTSESFLSNPIPSKVANTNKSNNGNENSKTTKNNHFDPIEEVRNYNALLQQKERWTIISSDLRTIFDSGNTAVVDKFRNSEKVLERIEQKLKESARKLGKN